MKPEEQRIAIAEACGLGDYGTRMNGWDAADIAAIPDYLHDLNAMHEAENTLLKNDALLWHKYASFLDSDYINQPYTVGATAAQRAEALLRTLNLWKE